MDMFKVRYTSILPVLLLSYFLIIIPTYILGKFRSLEAHKMQHEVFRVFLTYCTIPGHCNEIMVD